jgi:hypothetical protein
MIFSASFIALAVLLFSASGFVEGRSRQTGKAFGFFVLGCFFLYLGIYFERIVISI